MPGLDSGPAGALRLLRDVAARRAGHELRGDPSTFAPVDFAAHKRHDSATWAARTNAKTYTSDWGAIAFFALLVGLLVGLLAGLLLGLPVAPLAGLPSSSRASVAST